MRLSDKTWEKFKNERWKSKLGWERFIITKLEKKHEEETKHITKGIKFSRRGGKR